MWLWNYEWTPLRVKENQQSFKRVKLTKSPPIWTKRDQDFPKWKEACGPSSFHGQDAGWESFSVGGMGHFLWKSKYISNYKAENWEECWTGEPFPEMRTRLLITLPAPRRGRCDNTPRAGFQNAFSLPCTPLLFKRECLLKLSCPVSPCVLRGGENRWLCILAHRSVD